MKTDTTRLAFYTQLTRRQQEVLYWTVQGLSNRTIAAQLYVEPTVVSEHLTHIYDRLQDHWQVAERPQRYTLLLIFGDFFHQYPELRPQSVKGNSAE